MMRRKIQTIGWFIAFFALVWISPAMATDYELYIAGTQVTDANYNNLSKIAGVTVAPGGEFKYDPAMKTLTMRNVKVLAGDDKNAISNNGVKGLKIEVSGTNRLEATVGVGLACLASTEIEGSGSLIVVSVSNSGAYVYTETTLTISNITFEATGTLGISGLDGMQDEKLILKNAKVTATGTEAGIADLALLTTEGCQIIEPVGGKFNEAKHAVVDAKGDKVNKVKIEHIIELYIAGVQVTDANCNNLSKIAGVTVAPGGEFKYDPAMKTLTMKEVTVTPGNNKFAIWNKGVEGLKIVVSGTNRLKATNVPALSVLTSTLIEGSGALVTSCNSDSKNPSIFVYMSTELTISNITLEATGEWGIAGYDGTKNERLILKNAKITATGTKAGIADLAAFTTEGCKIISPEGGHFDEAKHAVVDADGNKAKDVKIAPIELYIAGMQVTEENCNDLRGIAVGITVASGGEFQYDPATKTLTMKDVTVLAGDGKIAIWNKGVEGLKIAVSGTNRLESTFIALECFASTEIEGSGSLTATSSAASVGVFVALNTTLTISDITFEATGKFGIVGGGKATLILKNAKVTAKGTDAGIVDIAELTNIGCKIVEPKGGHFDNAKHAIVDADGNMAKEVKIEPTIELYIAGTQVTDLNCKDLSKIEGVEVANGGEFKYDPAEKTLTMKSVTVSTKNKFAIYNKGVEGLKIVVSGTNRLEVKKKIALYCSASTEIKGSGSLVVVSSDGRGAVFVDNITLTISDITLEATGRCGITGRGGIQNETLILKNAKVTATGGTYAGIVDLALCTTEGCKIISPEGGKFDNAKHAIVDAEGNKAKEVKIEPIIELYIAGTQVTELNCKDVSKIEGVEVAKGGEFKYDPTAKILFMNRVTIEKSDQASIVNSIENLVIKVSGENTLKSVGNTFNEPTTVQGNGKLIIEAEGAGLYIAPNATLTISEITLEITGEWGIAGDNGKQNEKLIINHATVTAKGTNYAIGQLAAFTHTDCKIISPSGGKFDETKHAVVDADGNVAKEVKIASGGSAVTGITLSQHELSLLKGASATLTAEVTPSDASNKNFSWQSDNEEVAKVENGLVTAVGKGETIIRVTTEDAGKTDECKVQVKEAGEYVAVTGVKLSQKALTLKIGTSLKLVANVEPANATNKAVTWSSDNAAVASVSDAGLVEAKTEGTANITVTTQEGDHKASCLVTVTAEDVVLTGLTVSPSETRLKVGGEATLSVTYEPAGATQREVTWSTSDAAIVTVDEHGKVKAIAVGEATITVASKTNTSIKAPCKVIVEPTTAVKDAVFAGVVIAPNPFATQLRIVTGELRGEYALLNSTGVVVRSGNMEGNEVVIETNDLPSGLYLLRLTAENGATKTYCVVKQ